MHNRCSPPSNSKGGWGGGKHPSRTSPLLEVPPHYGMSLTITSIPHSKPFHGTFQVPLPPPPISPTTMTMFFGCYSEMATHTMFFRCQFSMVGRLAKNILVLKKVCNFLEQYLSSSKQAYNRLHILECSTPKKRKASSFCEKHTAILIKCNDFNQATKDHSPKILYYIILSTLIQARKNQIKSQSKQNPDYKSESAKQSQQIPGHSSMNESSSSKPRSRFIIKQAKPQIYKLINQSKTQIRLIRQTQIMNPAINQGGNTQKPKSLIMQSSKPRLSINESKENPDHQSIKQASK